MDTIKLLTTPSHCPRSMDNINKLFELVETKFKNTISDNFHYVEITIINDHFSQDDIIYMCDAYKNLGWRNVTFSYKPKSSENDGMSKWRLTFYYPTEINQNNL